MNVRKKLQINTVASIVTVLVVTIIVSIGLFRINDALEKLNLADEILYGLFKRNTFMHDYVMKGNDRAQEQWFDEHMRIGDEIQAAAEKFEIAEAKDIINRMIDDHEATGKLFWGIVENRERTRAGLVRVNLSEAIENRHLTQINIRLYNKLLNIQELRAGAKHLVLSELKLTGFELFIIIAIMVAMAAINSCSMRRLIANRISLLQKGSKIIGEGNLEYKINLNGNDEFTDLSRAFNAMTEKLNASYLEIQNEITERKRVEKELLKLNETLEQRVSEGTAMAEARSRQLQTLAVELIEAEERERGRIAQLLHDDLQQMLAAAKMQLQVASNHMPDEGLLKNVVHILEESIAKTRRMSHELSPAILHQAGLVAGLNWLSGQMNDQFGLETVLKINTDIRLQSTPLKIFLFRAVQELLFNVVKHAGIKRANVDLAVSDSFFAITVSDQGQGFDPEMLEKAENKIGFGLLTIKERAKYIGGKLLIESGPGKGSRFTLMIPKTMKDPGEESQIVNQPVYRQAKESELHPTSSIAGEIRVLFVDDHQAIRQGLIQLIANQPGIKVVGEASNGREAVEKSQQLSPEVIVMDISMPGMDGIEATRIIKSEMPNIRVIGLSMHLDKNISQAMREAGAESFVSKTASMAELLTAIYGVRQKESIRANQLDLKTNPLINDEIVGCDLLLQPVRKSSSG